MPKYFHHAGHRIAYYVHGNGEPIVFLHGWPTHSGLWDAQVGALSSTHRVITLDWLGFGASDQPLDHHYTFTHKKQVLTALLAQVLTADEQVTLVAHDIGGPPALLWAAENPKRVRRLILLNTVLYPLATLMDKTSHLFFHMPLLNDLLMSPFGLSRIMRGNTRSGDPAITERIDAIVSTYSEAPKTLKIRTILEPMNEGRRNELLTLNEKFAQLDTEKHLIIARQDPLCFAHIDKLRRENPKVPVHYIDQCGHYLPIDRPLELNAFLRRIIIVD